NLAPGTLLDPLSQALAGAGFASIGGFVRIAHEPRSRAATFPNGAVPREEMVRAGEADPARCSWGAVAARAAGGPVEGSPGPPDRAASHLMGAAPSVSGRGTWLPSADRGTR